MASGYHTRLPLDTLLDTGVLFVNGVAVGVTYSPSRGGLTFSPNIENRNIEYDGKKGNVAGLDRRIFVDPTISGNLLLFRSEDFRDMEGGAQRVTLPSAPTEGGNLFTAGQYIMNLTLRYRRAGGGFVDLFFPMAYCKQYEISGQDRSEAEAAVSFVAVQDPAGLGTHGGAMPYRIDVSIDLPQFITDLGSGIIGLYDGTTQVTASSGVVDTWRDARGVGFGADLTAVGTARPQYDSARGVLTFDNVDDQLSTASVAAFGFSNAGPKWIAALFANVDAVTTSITIVTRLLGAPSFGSIALSFGASGTILSYGSYGGTTGVQSTSTVPTRGVGLNRPRLAIATVRPGAVGTVEVANSAAIVGVTPALTATEAVASLKVGSGGASSLQIRFVVVGDGAYPTIAQIAAMKSYAIARGVDFA